MQQKQAWGALAFFCVTSTLASLYLGQDNSYDLRSYHLYNAWALLADRWPQDVFAAGAHSYFSPFLDVPYFLLAERLLPAHGAYVVALAGIPFGLLLFVLYLITQRVARCLGLGKWDQRAFIFAAVLVAGTGAATWSEVGTTFNDIPIAALVLASFHQVLTAADGAGAEPSRRRMAFAGMLLGLAIGLKLTAAIFVVPMAIVILGLGHGRRATGLGLAIYGACVAAAFAATYGPWAWKLHDLAGNPFFPFFNAIFQSDWMASVNVRDERFLPRSALQWIFYPFYWTTLQSSVVTEVPFRDVRLATAYVFIAGYAALLLARKEWRDALMGARYRSIHVLALFIASSYVVWLHQFSILRYLVATECLAGIFIIAATMAAARNLARWARWLPASCVVSMGAFIAGYGVSPQWGRVPAGTDIFAVRAPQFEPGALLVFADTPMSFLAPGLAATTPGLQFMTIPRNFSKGGRLGALGLGYGLERRMRAKLAAHDGSMYILYHGSGGVPESNLAAFDIRMDMKTCRPGVSSLGGELIACRGAYGQGRPIPK